jgi:predicted nucleotidyltransferase
VRVDASTQLFGFPILEIRAVLRGLGPIHLEWLAHRLGVGEARAKTLLKGLEREGYLEKIDSRHWQTTTKGNALGGATAAKPFSRSHANKLLIDLLKRMEQVRDDDAFAVTVERAIIFGSFMSDAQSLSDLDVGITFRPKNNDPEVQRAAELKVREEAQRGGRTFPSYADEVNWPTTAVERFLKSRKRISLIDLGLSGHRDLIAQSRHAVIYDRDRVVRDAVAGLL